MEYLIVLVILCAVVFVVTGPLRRGSAAAGVAAAEPGGSSPELTELEAAKEAKYREIRDAELDHQTGKLSDEDFTAIDRSLRAEAIEILRELDNRRAASE